MTAQTTRIGRHPLAFDPNHIEMTRDGGLLPSPPPPLPPRNANFAAALAFSRSALFLHRAAD